MFIRFRIKALYALAIAFGISFVWAMIAFGIFSSSVAEETLAAAIGPLWICMFGLTILLTDRYWHLPDPHADMFFALFSIKVWGILIALLGIFATFVSVQEVGFKGGFGNIMLFTLVSGALLVVLYAQLKKRFLARTPKV